jgi:pimeloyl-ACP methyl ester carboxylesterase
MRPCSAWFLCAMSASFLARGQSLPWPERAADAPDGSRFEQRVKDLPPARYDQEVCAQILAGNVPHFLRPLCPVTITNLSGGATNSATFFVTPDYLAVGTDDDFFRAPMTPATAQRIADNLDCILPTPKMVDAIYRAAEVKLAPLPIPPSAAMTTVRVFALHNEMVRTQRLESLAAHPPGALVAGPQKDVVICPQLAGAPGKVAIYGWHRTNGVAIQSLYLGHTAAWVDYSQCIRLVQQSMILNGATTTVAQVLADPKLCDLLSDEGMVTQPRYASGESQTNFVMEPDVKVCVNSPPAADFAADKPVRLIFYALPNGNTTAQTLGHKMRPGNDWHFDIQHIAAQTRFLRALITNRTVVLICLEAGSKSWPAWRKAHGDKDIPGIIESVEKQFATHRLEVVLAGHSGGGSFIFGYLNSVEKIPDNIERIAFLDSNYAYDESRGHAEKLAAWLGASESHWLTVLAYNDAAALLDGKPFVSAEGGTWGRSHAMLKDLGAKFEFASRTNSDGLELYSALGGRAQFFLRQNPDRKILHTVQVERNGFIHAMVAGTSDEGRSYEYFGPRAYTQWILAE